MWIRVSGATGVLPLTSAMVTQAPGRQLPFLLGSGLTGPCQDVASFQRCLGPRAPAARLVSLLSRPRPKVRSRASLWGTGSRVFEFLATCSHSFLKRIDLGVLGFLQFRRSLAHSPEQRIQALIPGPSEPSEPSEPSSSGATRGSGRARAAGARRREGL